MSIDIVAVFTALSKGHVFVPRDIIKQLGLEGRDEYLAMRACGYVVGAGLDYDEAYKVLGKDNVDSWIENGTNSDDFHPMAHKNLDYWCDPIERQKYYEEYLEKKSSLRRTGSIGVKLHPNFTIAEIEHSMRKEK